jgi:hypothetical protein
MIEVTAFKSNKGTISARKSDAMADDLTDETTQLIAKYLLCMAAWIDLLLLVMLIAGCTPY